MVFIQYPTLFPCDVDSPILLRNSSASFLSYFLGKSFFLLTRNFSWLISIPLLQGVNRTGRAKRRGYARSLRASKYLCSRLLLVSSRLSLPIPQAYEFGVWYYYLFAPPFHCHCDQYAIGGGMFYTVFLVKSDRFFTHKWCLDRKPNQVCTEFPNYLVLQYFIKMLRASCRYWLCD